MPSGRRPCLGPRIFGVPPGQIGGAGYYYLVERSGQWGTRKDLMDAYLDFSRYVYTEGYWGQHAPEAYNRQIQGSEVLLRSWSDRTRSPLSNKYDWYLGGSLSLAMKQLTGTEPDGFFPTSAIRTVPGWWPRKTPCGGIIACGCSIASGSKA